MPKKDTMRIRMTAQTSQALEEIETPTVNAAAALGYDAKRVRTVEGKNQVTLMCDVPAGVSARACLTVISEGKALRK